MSEFIRSEFIQIWAHLGTAEIVRRIRTLRGGFSRFFHECAPLSKNTSSDLTDLLQFRDRHVCLADRSRRQLAALDGKPGRN